jgi:NADH-quinone oxidoreductase subunit M
MPELMYLFLIPFAAGLLLQLLPMILSLSTANTKGLAIGFSLIPLFLLVWYHGSWVGSEVDYDWIPPLAIHFSLRVDALSLLFLYLTSIIIPISLLSINRNYLKYGASFYALVLLLQGLLIGFFASGDLALFTFFWEAMLLPLYFIIAYWGNEDRKNAALKFIIYMIAGSALMIAAVLFLFISASTFNMEALKGIATKSPHAIWIFAIFLLAFSVKTPLFPFHAWLPSTYCAAPTSGTILLSAILSKAGIYGIARIGIGFFPLFLEEWGPILLGLAITGVFYGGFAAWMENDYKRLIAYSSFSHVNFVLAGLFLWNQTAQTGTIFTGAILQAINHGITIAALFLAAGWLQERLGSTAITKAGGLAAYLPKLCWITLFFTLSSIALPGLNNFVGELMILLGLFQQERWLGALLATTVILSAIYMLRFIQGVYFGKAETQQGSWIDIRKEEELIALPLIGLIIWIGIYPGPILRLIATI